LLLCAWPIAACELLRRAGEAWLMEGRTAEVSAQLMDAAESIATFPVAITPNQKENNTHIQNIIEVFADSLS
jgi:hypothetical protein